MEENFVKRHGGHVARKNRRPRSEDNEGLIRDREARNTRRRRAAQDTKLFDAIKTQ